MDELEKILGPRTSLEQVKEFHEVFGHPVKNNPDLSDDKECSLRVALILEELKELQLALMTGDEIETLDALLDLQYVLDGAFLSLGFHKFKDVGMAEVHRSNMSKLGEDGKPVYREDGKILKGPKFSEPDLRSIIYV